MERNQENLEASPAFQAMCARIGRSARERLMLYVENVGLRMDGKWQGSIPATEVYDALHQGDARHFRAAFAQWAVRKGDCRETARGTWEFLTTDGRVAKEFDPVTGKTTTFDLLGGGVVWCRRERLVRGNLELTIALQFDGVVVP